MRDARTLQEIRARTLRDLRALEGTLWREVQGELHLQYNEMPTWVLLCEDSDIQAAHRAFAEIVSPWFERAAPVQFTVTYTILTDRRDITVDTLMDNRDILKAVGAGTLGAMPESRARGGDDVFEARLSNTCHPIAQK